MKENVTAGKRSNQDYFPIFLNGVKSISAIKQDSKFAQNRRNGEDETR
ncbi:MAG: hypothetical protein GXX85_09355 [Ignavibacteria bacterium]|nr:hypothetical protein [Ignavibacteria bacterium]